LLETTAAAGEAAKLHKFICQVVYIPGLPDMLQPGGQNLGLFPGGTRWNTVPTVENQPE